MSNAELSNLAASLAVLTCGIVIDFFFPPKALTEHSVARFSFRLWVLRWLLLVCGWLLFAGHLQNHHSTRWIVLFIVDSGSIVTQGFCWSLLWGDKLREDRARANKLVFRSIAGLMILTLWNCAFSYSATTWGPFSAWTLLSLMLATFNALMIGFVFASRSKVTSIAAVIFIIQLSYAVWEIPAYTETLAGAHVNDATYSNILAALKLMSGAVAYLIFCLPNTNYGPVDSGPIEWLKKCKSKLEVMFDPQQSPRINALLMNVISGLIVAIMISIVVAVYSWIGNHLPNLFPVEKK